MKVLDRSFSFPEYELACDEALVDLCEEGFPHEILRFWEPEKPFIVLGYSNKILSEIKPVRSRGPALPVLRRSSGGGSVLQAPGCLNYSLILRITSGGPLESIPKTNGYVLGRIRDALKPLLGETVQIQGSTDLTLGGLKFSGSAQRRKQRSLLFHGTFLCSMNLDLVEQCLEIPLRQPPYRRNRPHKDFLVNLGIDSVRIKQCLKTAWEARESLENIPHERIEKLMREKYSQREWNLKY